MKKRVALIFGGEGCERRISESGAANLLTLIDASEYEILPIGIDRDGAWFLYRGPHEKIGSGEWRADGEALTPTFPAKLGSRSGFIDGAKLLEVDCALPCLHGDFGEDGTVQGALTLAHIAYVGQDVYASAFTNDKIYTKLAAESLSIPVAKWLVADCEPLEAQRRAEEKIGYPMFIKPARLGSSFGAHPVRSPQEFGRLYAAAREFGERLLIEELIDVEFELECAMLDVGRRSFSPRGRILSGGAFYGFSEKYENVTSPQACVYGGDSETEKRITEYSESLAALIGLKELSRIDFFVTRDKKIYFNEINAFPGMTASSLYPKLTESMGLQKGEFINLLLCRACRHDRYI